MCPRPAHLQTGCFNLSWLPGRPLTFPHLPTHAQGQVAKQDPHPQLWPRHAEATAALSPDTWHHLFPWGWDPGGPMGGHNGCHVVTSILAGLLTR